MKYSLYINQPLAIKLGIKNINQAHIFDLLTTASTWAEPIIIGNRVYYWVARQKICTELELLNLKPDTVYRHLKDLDLLRLIDYIKHQKKDCMKITTKGKSYVISKNTMSEMNPKHYIGNESEKNNDSETNPKKLGNESEFSSEINPTYTTTKINPTTNLSSSKKTESFNAFRERIKNEYLKLNILQGVPGLFLQNTIISLSSTGYLHNEVSQKDLSSEDAKQVWAWMYSNQDAIMPKHKEVKAC